MGGADGPDKSIGLRRWAATKPVGRAGRAKDKESARCAGLPQWRIVYLGHTEDIEETIVIPGLIEQFADAEVAYRRERIQAEFTPRPASRRRRWLGGILHPARRHAGRAPLPRPPMPAPHHQHAAG